jgi:hypothetical protein
MRLLVGLSLLAGALNAQQPATISVTGAVAQPANLDGSGS